MRRFIIPILALAVAGCAKESQFATIKFNCTYGNTMTKVSDDEVRNAVLLAAEEITPTIIFYVNGRQYTKCLAGESVKLPIGNVQVTVDYWNNEGKSLGDVYFTTEPSLKADTTFAFHSYTREATIRTHYDCLMLIFDKAEVESVDGIPTVDYGNFLAAYALGSGKCELTLYAPYPSDFTDRTITVDFDTLEYGKFYKVGATGVTEGTASFGYAIDDFINGGVL